MLPWSRPLARLIYGYVSEPLRTLWLGLLGYVPNLFYLAIIAVTTFVVLRIVRFVFKEIEVGNIRLASFPDDWAEPTYKLVRTLLLAVAFVGAFPYIPGSQTPAFQGISLFLGLLVSLLQLRPLEHHRRHDPHLYAGLQGRRHRAHRRDVRRGDGQTPAGDAHANV